MLEFKDDALVFPRTVEFLSVTWALLTWTVQLSIFCAIFFNISVDPVDIIVKNLVSIVLKKTVPFLVRMHWRYMFSMEYPYVESIFSIFIWSLIENCLENLDKGIEYFEMKELRQETKRFRFWARKVFAGKTLQTWQKKF